MELDGLPLEIGFGLGLGGGSHDGRRAVVGRFAGQESGQACTVSLLRRLTPEYNMRNAMRQASHAQCYDHRGRGNAPSSALLDALRGMDGYGEDGQAHAQSY